MRALKTGVTVLLSGVLGLGKNEGPDTTLLLLEGFWIVDVEGVSIGGGYTVAIKSIRHPL